MVKTGTPARNMAIAAPLHAEWRPNWSDVKPNSSGPIESATVRNRASSSGPENRCIFPPFVWKVFTVVFGVDDLYDARRRMILLQIFTGHNSGSDVL
jgi:hypothetical protein